MRKLISFCLFMCLFQIKAAGAATSLSETSDNPPAKSCAALLIGHTSETADAFMNWSEIAGQLARRESATVLVSIPFSSLSGAVGKLNDLGLAANSGVEVLTSFSAFFEQSVVVVLRGASSSLQAAAPALIERYPGLSFQILSSVPLTRSFALPFPTRSVEFRSGGGPDVQAAEDSLAEGLSGVIYNSSTSQIIFVYPKEAIVGLSTNKLAELNITVVQIPQGTSLFEWMHGNAGNLSQGIAAHWRDRWVLSQAAFLKIKTLEGHPVQVTNVATTKVARALKDALASCASAVCEGPNPAQVATPVRAAPPNVPAVTPTVASATKGTPSAEGWDDNSTNDVVDALRFTIPSFRIRAEDSLLKVMMELARASRQGEELKKLESQLSQIAFTSNDVMYARTVSAARNRMRRGFALLLNKSNPKAEEVLAWLKTLRDQIAAASVANEPTQKASGVDDAPKLDPGTLASMMQFLRSQAVIGNIAAKGGVRGAFIDALSKLPNRVTESLGGLIVQVDKIGFLPWDYNTAVGGNSKKAVRRLIYGWRLLQSELRDPGYTKPIDHASIAATINLFHLQLPSSEVSPPEAVVLKPSTATASKPVPKSAQANDWSSDDVGSIINAFRTAIPGFRAHTPNALSDALATLSRASLQGQELEQTQAALNQIGFKLSDALNARIAGAARSRMIAGFALFLKKSDFEASEVVGWLTSLRPKEVAVPVASKVEPNKIEPSKVAYETISSAAQADILAFLKAKIAIGTLSSSGGLRRSYVDALSKLPQQTRHSTASIVAQVNAIGFLPSDYSGIVSANSVKAVQRLIRGWRLLQTELADPGLALPLDSASVAATISLYNSRFAPPVTLIVRRIESPSEDPSQGDGRETVTLSPSALQTLSKMGVRSAEIDEMVNDWHGYSLNRGLEIGGTNRKWTLLVSRPVGALVDVAYPAIIENGVVKQVLSVNTDYEKLFYKLLSWQLRTEQLHTNISYKSGSSVIAGELIVRPPVLVKMLIKHRFDRSALTELLHRLLLEHVNANTGALTLRDPQTGLRYTMSVEKANGSFILKTLFEIKNQ